MAILLITHDLGWWRRWRIGSGSCGRHQLMEISDVEDFFERLAHPYSRSCSDRCRRDERPQWPDVIPG